MKGRRIYHFTLINPREYRMDNQNWTIYDNWQHKSTQDQDKHNILRNIEIHKCIHVWVSSHTIFLYFYVVLKFDVLTEYMFSQ